MRLRIAAQNKPGRPGRNPLRDHFHGRPCSPRGSVVDRILPWCLTLDMDLPHGFPWIWEGLVKEDPFLIFIRERQQCHGKEWLPANGEGEPGPSPEISDKRCQVAWTFVDSNGISRSCMVLLQFLWHSYKVGNDGTPNFCWSLFFFYLESIFRNMGFGAFLKKLVPIIHENYDHPMMIDPVIINYPVWIFGL